MTDIFTLPNGTTWYKGQSVSFKVKGETGIRIGTVVDQDIEYDSYKGFIAGDWLVIREQDGSLATVNPKIVTANP